MYRARIQSSMQRGVFRSRRATSRFVIKPSTGETEDSELIRGLWHVPRILLCSRHTIVGAARLQWMHGRPSPRSASRVADIAISDVKGFEGLGSRRVWNPVAREG